MAVYGKIGKSAFALIALSCVAHGAHTWTGGASRTWDDARNWSDGEAPAPVKSAQFVFDSPAGATFKFDTPFECATLTTTTNAGQFSISAPLIRIGSNIADDNTDGWILEEVARAGEVVNKSAKPLVFNGTATLAHDTSFDAAGAAISLAGGLAGGKAFVKKGPADMMISGGKTAFSTFSLDEGRLALNDTEALITAAGTFSKNKNYNTDLILSGGSSLRTPLTASKTVEMNPRFAMSGKSKQNGASSLWDAGGNTLNIITYDFRLQNGAVITNAATVQFHNPPGNTNALEYVISGGSKIYCKGFIAANTFDSAYKFSYNSTIVLRGVPGAKPENQTLLDVGGGSLHLAKRHSWNCRAEYNTLLITDGARVENDARLGISQYIGSANKTTCIVKGLQITSCGGI
ncbi:MAG: hypothetical protein FWG05_03305 [Kiritimatiellaeota bacterium]|nr:hypothetical protein [Kiritimatiellota bacterium]